MGKLVLRLPDGSTREFALERERVTIGRRPDNDICLPFPAVSGEHAAVVTILDDSFLEDLNSTNGTLVNGKPISKHFLRDHDEIDIGRHTLVYVSGGYAPPLQKPLPEAMQTVAVTANGGATIGEDEATLVPASRAPALREPMSPSRVGPIRDAERRSSVAQPANADHPAIHDQPIAPVALGELTPDDAPSEPTADTPSRAPALEVLDGAAAGQVVPIGREDFVLGRLGTTIAAIRRTADGYRLMHVEGDAFPRVNGMTMPRDGALLATGDEIEVAGTRLLYRPAL